MSSQIHRLNASQKVLFDKVVDQKKNVFFTGCAGTGKSFVLKRIVDALQSIHSKSGAIAVTASTGKAAFNIAGSTLHSFAGIGLGKGSIDDIYKRVLFNKNALQRWEEVKVLIVDEISMIDGDLFDKLEYIARKIKGLLPGLETYN
jgi:ATP-dependent DNA helicase PIF1